MSARSGWNLLLGGSPFRGSCSWFVFDTSTSNGHDHGSMSPWLRSRPPPLRVWVCEGSETEGRGHRNVKAPAGPDSGSKQSTGLARVALKALAHCPWPEGSFPEEMTTLFDEEPIRMLEQEIYTQKALAEKLAVNPSTITRSLKGQRKSRRLERRIAEILRILSDGTETEEE